MSAAANSTSVSTPPSSMARSSGRASSSAAPEPYTAYGSSRGGGRSTATTSGVDNERAGPSTSTQHCTSISSLLELHTYLRSVPLRLNARCELDLQGSLPEHDCVLLLNHEMSLLNGALELPEGTCLRVESARVQMRNIQITGSGVAAGGQEAPTGLVTIGKGGALQAEYCSVSMTGELTLASGCMGILVCDSGSEELMVVAVQAAAAHGVLVHGTGSTASLQGCMADGNGGHGVAVAQGASMMCTACEVSHNSRHGFAVWGRGSKLDVGGCKADMNSACGFHASGEAKMVADEGCSATGNGDAGWLAAGGSYLAVAAGCEAARNVKRGFAVLGRFSVLECGQHCSALMNHGNGFSAEDDGTLRSGDDCKARISGGHGFAAAGGNLQAGARCVAEENAQSGFGVKRGEAVVGRDARSRNNRLHGFACVGPLTSMEVGEGASAADNGRHGLLANDGAVLRAGASCWAVGNACTGFMATRSVWGGGQLQLGADAQARLNKGNGFESNGRAKLRAGRGAAARENHIHGFLVGAKAMMILSEQTLAVDNMQSDFMALDAVRLYLCQTAGGSAAPDTTVQHVVCKGGRVTYGWKETADWPRITQMCACVVS